jgi:predicted HicB family RNase H-like nuclease
MPLSRRVTVASELFEQLAKKSQQEGISVETLVNLWIAEKLRSSS